MPEAPANVEAPPPSTPLTGRGSSSDDKLHAKNRAAQEAYVALVKTNAEIFRLSNDGRFPAKVSLSFAEQSKVRTRRKKTRRRLANVSLRRNRAIYLVGVIAPRVTRSQASFPLEKVCNSPRQPTDLEKTRNLMMPDTPSQGLRADIYRHITI